MIHFQAKNEKFVQLCNQEESKRFQEFGQINKEQMEISPDQSQISDARFGQYWEYEMMRF